LEDKDFKIESDDPRVSRALVRHIANVHNLVSGACDEYKTSHRRQVHVTPKSYLSFIKSYKLVYKEKVEQVTQQQRNIETGLSKLKQAERDVDRLKKILEQQNEELKKKEKDTLAVLAKLEKATADAKEKKAEADTIAAKCLQTEVIIAKERAVATRELEQAMPHVHQANKAAKSINKKELGLIQRMPRPPDLIKRIMDCVLILCMQPLERVTLAEIKTDRTTTQMFIGDSYETYAKNMMAQLSFVNTLVDFAAEDEKDATGAVLQPRMLSKDSINEETMELLEPYLMVPDFTPERARVVSQALESLCKWVRAMASYHNASLMVGPKLEALQIKTNMWTLARSKAERAKAQADDIQAMVDGYTRDFKDTMKEQEELRRKAAETQEMMARATALINSLSGEKRRWNQDLGVFADSKNRLVGDCALACAFVSYLGPFNYDYRRMLIESKFYKDCASSGIPVTKDLNLSSFLVDDGTIAEWNSQGLPKDDLSTQNGILVTQASRFPLLIDPQGQALSWLMTREAGSLPIWGSITLADEKLSDNLAYCLKEGKPLVIEGITKDVDPLLDPVLEKSVTMKGRQFFINLGDKSTLIDPNFRLYLITKLSNPQFSPELSAKTTIIDFSVTQQGLEDQLLSRVIQQEQRSMEEQRQKFNEEVNMNTISLQSLDKQLLERLAVSQSNLLEDAKLIEVLADTKVKAQEVKEKLNQAHEAAEVISKRRESYRAVATRGSVLYFVIVSMASVNCMYQTSLAQFLTWFDATMVEAEKANLVPARVQNLKKHLTYSVYTNINRGLFEPDKLTFKLMIALKVLLTEEEKSLTSDMITLLLKAGSVLSPEVIPKKPFDWLQPPAWANVYHLSTSLDFFADLKALIEQNPNAWSRWYEHESPESQEIPELEARLQGDPSGAFMRFLVIRCFRDDRTRLAAQDFIASVLGKKFIEPLPTRLSDIFKVSDSFTPIILLLTPGADPTSQLEELARRHKPSGRETKVYSCSMGQGQKPHAQKCVASAMEEGSWALLQNCHLGLGYMEELCDELKRAHDEKQVEPGFRLWITCEPHPDFPINLLQMSIKVTNEAPRGMQAGLLRSYTAVVDTERLTSLESVEWRNLVFTLCFLHSAVQERRKFGAIGWCIQYEFNTSDLEASLTFLEKTLTYASSNSALSWPTIQYMICEVQYGGRITDDQDRLLFNTFGKFWLTPQIFSPDFCFAPGHTNFNYCIPAVDNIEAYRKYIETVPSNDPPEIFGLHGNAELTFGSQESNYIFTTIADTQPKEGVGSSSSKASGAPVKTREEVISDEADKLLRQLPKGYVDEEVRDNVRRRPREEIYYVLGRRPASDEKVDGFSIPLNVFLYQEITRLNATISNVRKTLQDIKDAIKGDIMLTPDLLEAMNAVFDMKPPKQWYLDANRQEIAWTLPSLGAWFNGLLLREAQLTSWLMKERPAVFWLTGFFNPQGFLTAMRQEVNRRHANDKVKWALDDVVLVSEVTDYTAPARFKAGPDDNKGVYIHGLFLEGAGWDRKEKMLVEAQPKELYYPFPILCVTPETSSSAEKIYQGIREDLRWYDCPVYTKPRRTDSNLVFTVKLPTAALPGPQNSPILRGVALLCSKES
jgi:dynein heavy chain